MTLASVNSLESSTILIVNDTLNNLQLLFQYLKNTNYKFLAVYSGRKAIETARNVRPNLITSEFFLLVFCYFCSEYFGK